MSTSCNRLDLPTLGSQLSMPKNLPDHCFQLQLNEPVESTSSLFIELELETLGFSTDSVVWIKRNDTVFSHEQWHETNLKVKHRIWDELIMYAKAAWKPVIQQIKISSFSAMAMLQGFEKTWGARNILGRRNNLHIEWNWKHQHR
jgi:hypothetical protein